MPRTETRAFISMPRRSGALLFGTPITQTEIKSSQANNQAKGRHMPRGGLRTTSFKPGRSGNPTGLPNKPETIARLKVEADAKAIAKSYGEDAINALVEIMNNKAISAAARVSAATSLLDRGYGRPAQAVEMTGRDGGPIETANTDISARELIAGRIASLSERLRDDEGPSRLN